MSSFGMYDRNEGQCGSCGEIYHLSQRHVCPPSGGINDATPSDWDKAAELVRLEKERYKPLAEDAEPTDKELEAVIDDRLPFKALDRQVGGSHYKDCKIQPIEYIMANNLAYCEANIVKYITRHAMKGGGRDIEKVIHYAQILLEKQYG